MSDESYDDSDDSNVPIKELMVNCFELMGGGRSRGARTQILLPVIKRHLGGLCGHFCDKRSL